MTDDPAIAAFLVAQSDRRVRGAFRLVGALITVALVFVTVPASLEIFHKGLWVVYPAPPVVLWALGELVVAARREVRSRNPPIPRARVVR